jgi:putative thioredoxin
MGIRVDVTEATFRDEVIERSRDVPVVVDFWAEWCRPCRQLAPALEGAVAGRGGEVELAKVDIDANPGLAQAFGIQSIPAVTAFRDGRVVDGFVGLVPLPEIERFLDGLLPTEADRLAESGDEESLRRAIARDAGHVTARVRLARLLLADGRREEAGEAVAPVVHDPVAAGLAARIELGGAEEPDVVAGLAALERGDLEAGLTHLLDAVRVSSGERRDAIRRAMVGVFAELGDQHPLTLRVRPKLARALY